jgi:hypothetical protein
MREDAHLKSSVAGLLSAVLPDWSFVHHISVPNFKLFFKRICRFQGLSIFPDGNPQGFR